MEYMDEGLLNWARLYEEAQFASRVYNYISFLRSKNLPLAATDDFKEPIREMIEKEYGRITVDDLKRYKDIVKDVIIRGDYGRYDSIFPQEDLEDWVYEWDNMYSLLFGTKSGDDLNSILETHDQIRRKYQEFLARKTAEVNHWHYMYQLSKKDLTEPQNLEEFINPTAIGNLFRESFVENRVYKKQTKKKKKHPFLRKIAAAAAAFMMVGSTIAAINYAANNFNHNQISVARATDYEATQEWAKYIFHMDPNNSTQMHFVNVTLGLESDPNVIFNGVFAEELHNQSMAENLSALVNNYTYFFDNASGGGHWFAKEVAAGAINDTMLKTAMRIYALHPELLDDMDYLFLLSQTKNFQDGLNDTDKQVLANEVAAWENLQPFEKRFLLMFPVNATSYIKTPGDLLYSLFTYYANQWGIDPSNATQAKILLAYDAVFDGYYALKHVANGQSEAQFLDDYILKQAPAIGIDYLKLIAGMKTGAVGIAMKINPTHQQYIFGVFKDSKSTEALNGAQYEKAFIWLNETPRGYPNAYADARAFWNEQNLNETAIYLAGKMNKVGDNSAYNPIANIFSWIAGRLSNNSGEDDPGPRSFNDLYMIYYLNLTDGTKMNADCSSIAPLVDYLIKAQNYLFVRKNNTLTTDPHDPDVIGPLVSLGVSTETHVDNIALGWNASAGELGAGNTPTVMSQLGSNPYYYYTFFPTFPRYMVRAKTATANQLYGNIPGELWNPYYNRPSIKMITNNTPLSELQREIFGMMIDHDYNIPYGASWNSENSHPYEKYGLTGSEFPPIYRAIPTDEKVNGVPQVGSEVPEMNWLAAAVAPMVPIVRRIKSRFKKRRNH